MSFLYNLSHAICYSYGTDNKTFGTLFTEMHNMRTLLHLQLHTIAVNLHIYRISK